MSLNQKSSTVKNTTVLSIEDISENDNYVLVKITEAVGNIIVESIEKGIKDNSGDIIKFEKCS